MYSVSSFIGITSLPLGGEAAPPGDERRQVRLERGEIAFMSSQTNTSGLRWPGSQALPLLRNQVATGQNSPEGVDDLLI